MKKLLISCLALSLVPSLFGQLALEDPVFQNIQPSAGNPTGVPVFEDDVNGRSRLRSVPGFATTGSGAPGVGVATNPPFYLDTVAGDLYWHDGSIWVEAAKDSELNNVALVDNADGTMTFTNSTSSTTGFREGQLQRFNADNWMLMHEPGYANPNQLDPVGGRNVNLSGQKGYIGVQAMPSIGTVGSFGVGTPVEWAVDSAYPAGAAGVTFMAGYDSVANGSANISLGAHQFIKYHATGHSNILGGSWNLIWAGRSVIGGGSVNVISSTAEDSQYNVIPGGFNNRLDGTKYASSFGNGNVTTSTQFSEVHGTGISVTDSDHAHVRGSTHTVGTSLYASVSGATHTVTGADYSDTHGNGHTLTSAADYSVARGSGHTVGHAFATVRGAGGRSVSPHSDSMAYSNLNELGDAQISRHVMAVRTANDTITTMAPQINGFPAGAVYSGFGDIQIIGMRDGTANADADYTQVAYTIDVGFYWDGTNGYFFRSGASTPVTPAPTMDAVLVSQINNDFTPGAAPRLAISGGSLRLQVTGIAATTINWVAKLDLVYTVVTL